MNRILITLLAVFVTFAAHSQAPVIVGGSVLSQLQSIQAANRALIERQEKTLVTLDALQATAAQIKAFSKR